MKNHSAIKSLYTSSLDIRPSRRRWDSIIMYGRMLDDDKLIIQTSSMEDYKKLEILRRHSDKAVSENNESAFVDEAFKTVEWMNALKTSCPFHFPSQLSFIKDPAPCSEIIQSGLAKVFRKVVDLRGEAGHRAKPNNAFGIAITGARGVGKSICLRLLTILPSLLLPDNILSVYIDYANCNPADTTPRIVFHDALCCSMGTNMPSAIGLEGILTNQKRIAILAADEIESVYSNRKIWNEFHILTTKHTTNLFVAGSGSKVRSMIEKKVTSRNCVDGFHLLKTIFLNL